MAAITSNFCLYSLTLRPSSAVTTSVVGVFAGGKPNDQLLLSAVGSRLNLYRPNASTPFHSTDVFGTIRCLAPFRLYGMPKDYIVILTDSGRFITLEYQPTTNTFDRIHCETFGKSGVRRAVPGQYLAMDPRGRCALIASHEKNKLAYLLNRDSNGRLTISSPLEANQNRAIVYDMIALDVQDMDPTFAALEVDYTPLVEEENLEDEFDEEHMEIDTPVLHSTSKGYHRELRRQQKERSRNLQDDQNDRGLDPRLTKELVYYELDLGLNHIVRKWADRVEETSNRLFRVPTSRERMSPSQGPGGVLVCAEETVTYRHVARHAQRFIIPRRIGPSQDPNKRAYIVAGTMHRNRGSFFFLLQTSLGDLWKLTMEVNERGTRDFGQVTALNGQYWGTVPIAKDLHIFRNATLLVITESGDHLLYLIDHLGTEYPMKRSHQYKTTDLDRKGIPDYEPDFFYPHEVDHLHLAKRIENFSPTTSSVVANLQTKAGLRNDAPQIFTACGSGARSSLKMTQHGLEVTQLGFSELPVKPKNIWTTKLRHEDQSDSYIVLGLESDTLVLSVGESIEDVPQSQTGFVAGVPTLAVQLMADDALVQVHHQGLRHIRHAGPTNDWEPPVHTYIVAAATNARQIAIGLSNGALVYFEIEDETGTLTEIETGTTMEGSIVAMSFGDVPEGAKRSPFLAVACDSDTPSIRLLDTDPSKDLSTLSTQSLSARPSGLHIMRMASSATQKSPLYLHVGLTSGLYIRSTINEIKGDLGDAMTRHLGAKPVKFSSQVFVDEQPALLAISSRTWLAYIDTSTMTPKMTPLAYDALDYAAPLRSDVVTDGLVGVAGKTLRVFHISSVSDDQLTRSTPLKYTPKAVAKHPIYDYFVVAGSDSHTLPPLAQARTNYGTEKFKNISTEFASRKVFGDPKVKDHWSSCIQVVDPQNRRVLYTYELAENEAAVSLVIAPIVSQDMEPFLFVGTGKDMVQTPRGSKCGYIHVFRIHIEDVNGEDVEVDDDDSQVDESIEDEREPRRHKVYLEHLHQTEVADPPYSLLPFQSRLLAGIGRDLSIYDVGLKRLLRKATRADCAPTTITSLNTQGNRILVGDARESIIYVVYHVDVHGNQTLMPFADDTLARYTTCSTMVDYRTVAGGDRFGNFFILRCSAWASKDSDSDGAIPLLSHQRGYLGGCSSKLETIAHFYTNDVPLSVHKTPLVSGGGEVLLWSGLQGTTGIFIPFMNRDDVDFFGTLERQMRIHDEPLCGRDHVAFRGLYVPPKGVIDGDLCERYLQLPRDKQHQIAMVCEKNIRTVKKKITEMRIRYAY